MAVFIGHSIVPHVHHDGDEPWHLKNHFASHDSHKSLVVHFHHHKTDKDSENACHFNPNPLPVVKDQLKTPYLNSASVGDQFVRTAEKLIYPISISLFPDNYHKPILPRGPPAFYC